MDSPVFNCLPHEPGRRLGSCEKGDANSRSRSGESAVGQKPDPTAKSGYFFLLNGPKRLSAHSGPYLPPGP